MKKFIKLLQSTRPAALANAVRTRQNYMNKQLFPHILLLL